MASNVTITDSGTHLCTDMYEDWVVITEERDAEDENPDIRDHDLPWYRGRMNRSVAEDHLSTSQRFDGTFIVRESDAISMHREPVYMISVLLNGETHHVEVEKRPDGKYALAHVRGAKGYKSLKKLIKHYQGKPLDLEGGGRIKLKYYLE